MRLTFWNINESMNPFVSNFLWAGGMEGRLGWCDTSNLVGVTELHNRFHACLCVSHFSSLACTSYSPISSFSRSKKTGPFLLSSCFLYLERKVRGWKTCRNGFLGLLVSVSGSGEADGSLKPGVSKQWWWWCPLFGKKTIVNVNQEEKQFEQEYRSL